ncbi:MAG: arginine N-succinyltransferase [Myxococcales bacterium]|nr:arginine N-succinyltransferase [Myxococcales bacterium]MCB9532388.1 arginine N-succinyltransferase [Myxococcales bacterium]
MFFVREAEAADLDALEALAGSLDTVNLPNDRAALGALLRQSTDAFAAGAAVPSARYLFALIDATGGGVVGVSMVIASHGTPADPHHSLVREIDQRYAPAVGRVFQHDVLRFRGSYTPHTELGALVVAPSHRRRPERLGALLSYARLLYLAAHPARFHDTLQAELLPPFEADGSSRLWNHVGRHFTGLTYAEADRLSRTDPDFMRRLFPEAPIYVALLPAEVREVIGVVGAQSLGAERLLRAVGFAPNGHIDPFDGGPHFEARVDAVRVVRDAVRAQLFVADCPTPRDATPQDPTVLLTPLGAPFRCAYGDGTTSAPVVTGAAAAALGVAAGDEVLATPLPRRET